MCERSKSATFVFVSVALLCVLGSRADQNVVMSDDSKVARSACLRV